MSIGHRSKVMCSCQFELFIIKVRLCGNNMSMSVEHVGRVMYFKCNVKGTLIILYYALQKLSWTIGSLIFFKQSGFIIKFS